MMKSYVVPCSSRFRDAVTDLARRRGATLSGLAREAICLGVDRAERLADPGDAERGDREEIRLRRGPRRGRTMRRKPRLQLRLPDGLSSPAIRRLLALRLAVEERDPLAALEEAVAEARAEAADLRRDRAVLAFDLLPGGVRTARDALYVLGFPPSAKPDRPAQKTRFRALSLIFHPDRPGGDAARMAQLNEAIALLGRAAP
ncbi:J domain-containing protein [Inquilinus sp. CAU 1745]|uniref:J domain-containing protein n=1 Tax=Inquilinus sp. CAU 1745 TaxID=3140369 RepID=UPI00325A8CAA